MTQRTMRYTGAIVHAATPPWRRFAALALAMLAILMCATRAPAVCVGDCSGDGSVTVDELLTMVNIALGAAAVSSCPAGDANADQQITVDEILTAVTNALNGCSIAGASPTPSPTGSLVPTAPPTPTPPAGCGNGAVDFNLGETCDDGNTLDNASLDDVCPYNCRIAACTGAGTTRILDVSFTPSAGVDVISLLFFIRYPDGIVKIPGLHTEQQVQDRILNAPDGAFVTANDIDYALRLSIYNTDVPPTPFTPGMLFSVEFDDCSAARAPVASDFSCTVDQAAGVDTLPVEGVTCAVNIH